MSFRVLTGVENLEVPAGGRVRAALVSNQASVDGSLRRTADRLSSMKGIELKALLAPEHGMYGVEQDMVAVGDAVDAHLGMPVKSLYGGNEETLAPAAGLLKDCDAVFVDLQDVGSRYYTFVSTLFHCMKVCAAAGPRVVVLDRPNPIGGLLVEGNGVEPRFKSFVGVHNLAVRHGMTIGELAGMLNLEEGIGCRLEVVRMSGWSRGMPFSGTGLPWVAPSPNMPSPSTAMVYPGMCLVEGTNLSEGRGTTRPFELCGAPFIDPFAFCKELNSLGLPGAYFRPDYFKPQFHKFSGRVCGGFQLHFTDPQLFKPYLAGVAVLAAAKRMYPDGFAWRTERYEFVSDRPAIDLLTGTDLVRKWIDEGRQLRDFREFFEAGAEEFAQRRKQYLLYGDR
jgi:uncharacterized protein YbbC (DUF1343 family)